VPRGHATKRERHPQSGDPPRRPVRIETTPVPGLPFGRFAARPARAVWPDRQDRRPRRSRQPRGRSGSPGTRLGRPFGPGFALRPGLIGQKSAPGAKTPFGAHCPLYGARPAQASHCAIGRERPKGRKIGEKAAPARRANGKQAHAMTPPPIKEEERDTAGPPITRRTPEPAGQARHPWRIFHNHRPARRVTKRVYVSSYTDAPGRADMEIRAPRRKGQTPKTPFKDTRSGHMRNRHLIAKP